jgi:hypothetical protein
MSDDFLSRWSRRKREVAKAEPPETKARAPVVPPEGGATAEKKTATPQPEFDIATLPSIESINAVSDVTAFLRAGVPVELTRAALRRVWTADPAIRDFVGLAENAWDFTDPNAMPGFGPLETTDEVRRMIAQLVDQIGKAAQPSPPGAPERHAEIVENSNDSSVINSVKDVDARSQTTSETDQTQEKPAQILSNQVVVQSNTEDIATQHDPTEAQEKPKQLAKRLHGGALPR